MAIVSFACVTLLALLGNGLVSVKNSIGTTVSADIVQAMINNSQVASYSELATNSSFGTSTPVLTNYFDSQGDPVAKTNAVYTATVVAGPLKYASGSAGTYNYTNSACLLNIKVVNVANPGQPYNFSLLWSNSGK